MVEFLKPPVGLDPLAALLDRNTLLVNNQFRAQLAAQTVRYIRPEARAELERVIFDAVFYAQTEALMRYGAEKAQREALPPAANPLALPKG